MRETFILDNRYTEAQRRNIGEAIIRFIKERTRSGRGIAGVPFKPYSQSYKDSKDFDVAGKSSLVNLTLTGDMLDSMEVLSAPPGRVIIGFDDLSSKEKASYMEEHGRAFLGLSANELSGIVAKFPIEGGAIQNLDRSVLAGFLRGLIGNR